MAEMKPKFGDTVRGIYASECNPQRDGFYVNTVRRRGKLNPGTWYRLTDGHGRFWEYPAKNTVIVNTRTETRVMTPMADQPTKDIYRSGFMDGWDAQICAVRDDDEKTSDQHLEAAWKNTTSTAPREPWPTKDSLDCGSDRPRAEATEDFDALMEKIRQDYADLPEAEWFRKVYDGRSLGETIAITQPSEAPLREIEEVLDKALNDEMTMEGAVLAAANIARAALNTESQGDE